MKIPASFLDTNGKSAKGEVIVVRGEDDEATLEEFGTVHEGNKISCYVITSPGQILKVRFALNAAIADQADLVVDGVLRSSIQNKSAKGFKGAFDKALYKDQKPNGRRGAIRYCSMRVKERNTAKDIALEGGKTASAVGSFAIQLYRRDQAANDEASSSDKEPSSSSSPPAEGSKSIALRSPHFNDFAEWFDCNCNITYDGPPPPFEIEFIDQKEGGKRPKELVLKELSGYELWATFVFHIRSTADLRSLGFDCPTYYSSSLPPSLPTQLQRTKDSTPAGAPPQSKRSLLDGVFDETTKVDNEKLESERAEAAPRHNPVYAPQQTISGLLNLMSKSNRDVFLDKGIASDGSVIPGVPSVVGDETSNLDDSIESDATAAGPRTVVDKVVADSKYDGSVEEASIVDHSEDRFTFHFPPIVKPEISDGDVYPKEKPMDDLPQATVRSKHVTLPGVKGAPAHRAYLERAPTEETDSRPTTPMPDWPQVEKGKFQSFSTFQQIKTNVPLSTKRQTSLPPEPIVSMEGGRYHQSGNQGTASYSTWKPMTPPVSSLKGQFEQAQLVSLGMQDVWRSPNLDSVKSVIPLGSFPKALEAKSQGGLSNAGISSPRDSLARSQSAQVPEAISKPRTLIHSNLSQLPSISIAYGRALSEVPSDADTEVADPEDIERSVKSSQKTDSMVSSGVSQHQAKFETFQNASASKSEPVKVERTNHTYPSPILGRSITSSLNSTTTSPLSSSTNAGSWTPHGVHTQQSMRRSNDGPVTTTTLSNSPNLHQGAIRTPLPNAPQPSILLNSQQSFRRPASQSQFVAPVRDNEKPSSRSEAGSQTATMPKTVEKRNADAMTGDNDVGLNVPRKTSVPLSKAKVGNVEARRLAAEARISAAQKEKERLQKELSVALVVEAKLQEIREIDERAAAVEKENVEILARINSIYGSRDAE